MSFIADEEIKQNIYPVRCRGVNGINAPAMIQGDILPKLVILNKYGPTQHPNQKATPIVICVIIPEDISGEDCLSSIQSNGTAVISLVLLEHILFD